MKIGPGNIERINIRRVIINEYIINEIKVDLKHVNFGVNRVKGKYNSNQRSSYTLENMIKLVFAMDGKIFDEVGEDSEHRYYINEGIMKEQGKKFKMVFGLSKSIENVINIITVYRLRG